MHNYASAEQVSIVADRFAAQLSNVHDDSVFRLPEFTAAINHSGRPTEPDELDKPGLYIDHRQFGLDESLECTDWQFRLKPGNRIGREDSHRGLILGTMAVRPSVES